MLENSVLPAFKQTLVFVKHDYNSNSLFEVTTY